MKHLVSVTLEFMKYSVNLFYCLHDLFTVVYSAHYMFLWLKHNNTALWLTPQKISKRF